MAKHSAGILMYRFRGPTLEVFLVHPGGPYWAKRDIGAWSIPKGEFNKDEQDPLVVAKAEFEEETGFAVDGNFIPLDKLKQPGGKIIHAWAIEGDCDASKIKSNTFCIEWPPRSGKQQEFPEVDRASWFSVEEAKIKLLKGQVEFVRRILDRLNFKQS